LVEGLVRAIKREEGPSVKHKKEEDLNPLIQQRLFHLYHPGQEAEGAKKNLFDILENSELETSIFVYEGDKSSRESKSRYLKFSVSSLEVLEKQRKVIKVVDVSDSVLYD